MDDKPTAVPPQAVQIVDVQIRFGSMVELVFKFLLALLCASALLGAVVGLLAAFVMVSFKTLH